MPPPNTLLVAEEHPASEVFAANKSPKSVASPAEAIVMKLITLVVAPNTLDCPPANIPRVSLLPVPILDEVTVKSPKSAALPADEKEINCMTLTMVFPVTLPPANTPLAEDAQALIFSVSEIKSPKSVALPVVVIIIELITLTLCEDVLLPPPKTPVGAAGVTLPLAALKGPGP